MKTKGLISVMALTWLILGFMTQHRALAAGTWTPTGDLNPGRAYHTMTLLANGKVLVAGGYIDDTPLTSAQLYDQGTGAWTATGDLKTGRGQHTATLLNDGTVLAAGGISGAAFLTSTEVYAGGAWTITGPLATGRAYHTATLLKNGKVLVAGGIFLTPSLHFQSLASAELYDPAGSWANTASLSYSRYLHTATLLPNGKVLVVGGGYIDANGIFHLLVNAELFTPTSTSGSWSSAGSLHFARSHHTATLLSNGKVLVAGGSNDTGYPTTAELYDPDSNTWTTTGDLKVGRELHTATLLSNGLVLVGGGSNASSDYLESAELYNPTSEIWSDTGSLKTGRWQHQATLLPNGKVLVAGGLGTSGELANAELYNQASNTTGATDLLLLSE